MSTLINELFELSEDFIIETGFNTVLEHLKKMRELSNIILVEGFMNDHRGDLERQFDDLEKKIIAAQRGLGLTNSGALSPEAKRVNRSKIMTVLNKFRAQLHDVMLKLGMGEREIEYHLNRIGFDSSYGKPSEVHTRIPVEDERETGKFSQQFNKVRNLANPDDLNALKGHKPQKPKWYSRFF